jgi:hypothetical protein
LYFSVAQNQFLQRAVISIASAFQKNAQGTNIFAMQRPTRPCMQGLVGRCVVIVFLKKEKKGNKRMFLSVLF